MYDVWLRCVFYTPPHPLSRGELWATRSVPTYSFRLPRVFSLLFYLSPIIKTLLKADGFGLSQTVVLLEFRTEMLDCHGMCELFQSFGILLQ